VIGVMPAGFAMPSDEVVWAPKVLAGWERQARTSNFYTVFGRLRAGVSAAEAESDLRTVAARLSQEHPRTNADSGVSVVALPEQILGRARRALLLLLGAVGLVLAVVMASVASMQLARVTTREQEFAIRCTLGAGPGRVVRQLLVENLLLVCAGTAVGFALAKLTLDGVRALAPAELPRMNELGTDSRVLVFAACASLLTVLATGLAPVWIALRSPLQHGLVQAGRSSTGGRALGRAQGALVVFQLCTSLVLLIGAGLLLRSFVSVLGQDRGFRSDGVVAATVQTWSYYPQPADRAGFVREVTERLAALPGIRAAGMTSSLPLMESSGAEQAPLTIEGAPPPAAGEDAPLVHFTVVSPGLFRTLDIPLRQGRLLDGRDDAGRAPVALVNETFVRRFLADEEPLGKRMALGGSAARGQQRPVLREIVGIVGDVRRVALHEEARPGVYVPHAQMPTGANAIVVWGQGRPSELLAMTRRAIWESNPSLPIYRETTMAELIGTSVRERRFLLALLGGFAAMALGLAAAGLFGLMSYLTAQRTREFGVRMALGAARRQLLGLVLRRGLTLAALGIGLGLAGALALTRLLAGLLFDVTPLDAATFSAGITVLLVTAAGASLYPAWRAATTDPLAALRE
jgi:putative ABC transport system permease protein